MSARVSPARERILATASKLFYKHGIHKVGIDRIIAESGAAKMTFYHHFPSKDNLILAYLSRINGQWSTWLQSQVAAASPDPRVRLIGVFDALEEWFRTPEFRGCPFINMVAETGDPASPLFKAAWEFKRGFRDYLVELAREARLHNPRELAEQLLMLADGAIIQAAMRGDAGSARTAKKAAKMLIAAARD